jgi:hypothetical protein
LRNDLTLLREQRVVVPNCEKRQILPVHELPAIVA